MLDIITFIISCFAAFITNCLISHEKGVDGVLSNVKSSLVIGAVLYLILKVCTGMF